MNITLRPATPADAAPCAEAMYKAFDTLDRRHHFPSYFTDPNHALTAAQNLIASPHTYSLIAETDGRVAGSAFMNEKRPIHAIGPVSIHPDFQNLGIGRKLMHALLDRAANAPSVRLTQDAFNMASFALYLSLGFQPMASLVLLQGHFTHPPDSAIDIRPLLPTDRAACISLSHRVLGYDRGPSDLTGACGAFCNNRLVAYTSGLTVDGYTLGETEADVYALMRGLSAQMPGTRAFLMPLTQPDLMRTCLNEGFRAMKPLNLMVKGDYAPPQGVYLPNLLY